MSNYKLAYAVFTEDHDIMRVGTCFRKQIEHSQVLTEQHRSIRNLMRSSRVNFQPITKEREIIEYLNTSGGPSTHNHPSGKYTV